MTIKTSKNKTYTVNWCAALITDPNHMMLQMKDERRLPKIAAEFDGLEKVERFDENQGNETYEGYTALNAISRNAAGAVLITLAKEAVT